MDVHMTKKLIGNILGVLLVVLLTCLVSWGFAAYVLAEWNPLDWDWISRALHASATVGMTWAWFGYVKG